MAYRKIDIRDIKGFKLGNAENLEAGTGCTCIVCENGAVAGVDVRGGGPATRETDLLRSENSIERINAVVLSGGSAFGLEAGSGVMRELAEKNIGFAVGNHRVPIVCQASLFDLEVGRADIFPDVEMGRQAVRNAYEGVFSCGNRGAGTGASVGKLCGMDRAMKSGLGSYACGDDVLQVGAIVAVNALGDVYDGANNIAAGVLNEEHTRIEGSVRTLKQLVHTGYVIDRKEEAALRYKKLGYDVNFNTTIACLITNAKFTKAQANKLASILHDAYARAIKPVHSTMDGDTIFVMSTAEADVNFDAFAALATDIMQYSIIDAAMSCEDAYGMKSAKHFR